MQNYAQIEKNSSNDSYVFPTVEMCKSLLQRIHS